MNKILLEKSYDSLFNNEEIHIQSGYLEIDSLLSKCGCRKGSLITIGGRPSMGKTTFTMNLAEQFLTRGKRCLYFSLDMPAENFAQRLIFQRAEVHLDKIESKNFSENDLKKLSFAKSTIEKWDLHICDEGFMCVERIDDLVRKIKPDYVFIDTVQNIWADKVTIRHFTRRLKEIIRTKKLNTSALNKINDILDSLPKLDDLVDLERDINIEQIQELIKELEVSSVPFYSYSDPFKEIRPEPLIMDYAAKQLKIIAKKSATTIFINSQLTRATEYRQFHYPKIEDLSAPQSLATISDAVMMLYREEYYNRSEEEFKKNTMEVHFLKKHCGIAELLFDPYTLKIISRPNTNIF